MEDKDKKTIFYKLIIATAIIIPVIIGISYAYFLAIIKGNETSTTISGTAVKVLNFDLVTENNGYINAEEIIPIPNENAKREATLGRFTISTVAPSGKDSNAYNVSYSITLSEITMTSALASAVSDLKWSLTCVSSNCKNDATKNVSGSLSGISNSEKVLVSNLIIAPETTDAYELRIWITETTSNQISLMNQSFSAKVKATGEFVVSS